MSDEDRDEARASAGTYEDGIEVTCFGLHHRTQTIKCATVELAGDAITCKHARGTVTTILVDPTRGTFSGGFTAVEISCPSRFSWHTRRCTDHGWSTSTAGSTYVRLRVELVDSAHGSTSLVNVSATSKALPSGAGVPRSVWTSLLHTRAWHEDDGSVSWGQRSKLNTWDDGTISFVLFPSGLSANPGDEDRDEARASSGSSAEATALRVDQELADYAKRLRLPFGTASMLLHEAFTSLLPERALQLTSEELVARLKNFAWGTRNERGARVSAYVFGGDSAWRHPRIRFAGGVRSLTTASEWLEDEWWRGPAPLNYEDCFGRLVRNLPGRRVDFYADVADGLVLTVEFRDLLEWAWWRSSET